MDWEPVPGTRIQFEHVGFIPDGGRRWAAREGVSLTESYSRSFAILARTIEVFHSRYATTDFSVYLLSKPNLRRSQDEIVSLAQAMFELAGRWLPSIRPSMGSVVCVGSDTGLSSPLLDARAELSAVGAGDGIRLNLLIGYSPTDELAAASDSQQRCGGLFASHLWIPKRVDLVVRSGGARTLSDFLPVQSGYAQLYFIDDLWNDLRPDEIGELVRASTLKHPKYGE